MQIYLKTQFLCGFYAFFWEIYRFRFGFLALARLADFDDGGGGLASSCLNPASKLIPFTRISLDLGIFRLRFPFT